MDDERRFPEDGTPGAGAAPRPAGGSPAGDARHGADRSTAPGALFRYDAGVPVESSVPLSDEELAEVTRRAGAERATLVRVTEDGGELVLALVRPSAPFERIRRITGYLSPLPRWNNAKKSEYRDRVKHGT